jgi:hypothetical protein
MDDLPKPLGLCTLSCVAFNKAAIFLPGLEIKSARATDKLFQFLRLEELNHQVFIANLVKTSFESSKLILTLFDKRVLNIEPYILFTVLLSDKNFSAIRFQLKVNDFTEILDFNGERGP